MPHKTIKMALVDALEDLTKEDFDKFCHQLLDRRQEPRVKRNKVENKSRLQITDVLVSHFTEEGALQVTVDILRQMGSSEEAKTLEDTCGQSPEPEPGPSDASGGAADGCKMADGQHFVDKYRRDLVQRVGNIAPILDELLEKKVIDQEAYYRISALQIPQDKMREIYKSCLNAEKSKDSFYKSLLANEKFLIEELKQKK